MCFRIPYKHRSKGKRAYFYLLRMVLEKGYRHPDQDFDAMIKENRNGVWVDLGCGTNSFVRRHRMLFRSAIGVDGDLALLTRPLNERPNIICNIKELPFKAETVDLASCFMVVEHFDGNNRELCEIRRVLKVKAAFICATVNRDFWGSRVNRILPESLKRKLLGIFLNQSEEDIYPAYYRLNRRSDVDNALQSSGLRLIRWKAVKSYYPISVPIFWLQHFAFGCLFRRASIGVSNFNFVARKLSQGHTNNHL